MTRSSNSAFKFAANCSKVHKVVGPLTAGLRTS